MRRVIMDSLATYRELEQSGYDVGLKQCGSLALAQSQDRLIAMKRRISYNKPNGLNCELVTPAQIREIHPYLNVDDLQGGVYVPDDAVADPNALSDALIDIAKKNGVSYREQCQVQFIQTDAKDRVVGVETDAGVVKCEYFVNCAGMWARELGLKTKKPVKIPAYPAEHYYAITSGMSMPTDKTLPCVRDYDASSYSRQFNDEMLIGWFEQEARAAFAGHVPKNWMKDLKEDLPHLEQLWENAVERFPLLKNCQSPYVSNTPDNFTPDGRWILGESAEVNNYYVAVGTNGNSIQGAGGIGKAVAEWIIEGRPTQELFPFSIQRFLELHNNRQFLEQRVKEVVGHHYAISYPNMEYKYGRKLRCSPLYSVLEERRAVFGTVMAYERALYFDTSLKRGQLPLPEMPANSFFKPKFFNFLQDEYTACSETVGVIDISSFSKIKIKSQHIEDIVGYLQKLCCNDVDIPIGTCIKTGMLNESGGFENECTLVRQTLNSFFMVSPSSQQTRIYEWMENNLEDSSVKLSDETSMYTVLNVVGPKAFRLMSELTNSDVNLPPFRYKKVNVGYASDVMLMSLTHTGETGYCLYVPSEYALHLYDEIMKLGVDYGAKDCGTLTQKFMRIERFIPLMGDELSSVVTPLEAGLENCVNFDKKSDFIGRDALIKQRQNGIKKRLVMFLLEDHNIDDNIWAWGSEPIYRNSEYVGTVTSAGYGFTSNKLVCLGFIRMPENQRNENITKEFIMDKSSLYHIDIAGRLFSATPYLDVPPHLELREKERAASGSYRPSAVFNVKKRQ